MRASHLRIALWRGFMESDTGDDFAVVNFIHYKDEPDRLAFCHGAG